LLVILTYIYIYIYIANKKLEMVCYCNIIKTAAEIYEVLY